MVSMAAQSRILFFHMGIETGFLGVGHMGRAILEGGLDAGLWPANSVLVVDRHDKRRAAVEPLGCVVAADIQMLRDLICDANGIVLEPYDNAALNRGKTPDFKLMKDDAVFVNTSRGDNIDETALIEELEKGRLFAFLDVTSPEPPRSDSPLRKLPNCVLTPHVAGQQSYRIGDLVVEELRRCFAGEEQKFQVTRDMLDRMA